MNSHWTTDDNEYFLTDTTSSRQEKHLPVGVYRLDYRSSPPAARPHLTRLSDRFIFPSRLYGVSSDFVTHVVRTWNHTNANLGVLLTGIRGTGKTVTAQLIADALQLPVLLCQQDPPGLVEFLNSITQEVVVFFDEYEKTFHPADDDKYADPGDKLLTLMDGVFKNESRKLYLLTTNELNINENFLSRPGRIRYVKSFTNLPAEVVEEIVDDQLQPEVTHLREAVIEYLSRLQLVTIDLVTCVCQEVNIHQAAPDSFGDVFNAQKVDRRYEVYEVALDADGQAILSTTTGFPSEKQVSTRDRIGNYRAEEYSLGDYFYLKGKVVGEISEIVGELEFLVETTERNEENEHITTTRRFRLEPSILYNTVFSRVPTALTA